MEGAVQVEEGDQSSQGQETSDSTPPTTSDHASTTARTLETTAGGSTKRGPPPRGPKRRTKTGCLTCRKRRIKCGEEKPRCNNCIKAKRECEGYTQRVIFKHPMGPPGVFHPGLGPEMQPISSRMPLFPQQPSTGQGLNPQQRLLAPRMPTGPMAYASAPEQSSSGRQGDFVDQPRPFHYPPLYETVGESGPSRPLQVTPQPLPSTGSDDAFGSHHMASSAHDAYAQPFAQPFNPGRSYPVDHPSQLAGTRSRRSDQASLLDQRYLESMDFPTQGQLSSWDLGKEALPPQITLPASSHGVYYDDDSDEYYDVDTDEEMEEATHEDGINQLSLIIDSAKQDETAVRSYTTFLNEPNILVSYRPSIGSSPLNNPTTARIWVHFIHATSAALSIWERRSTNSSILLNGPVPTSQQGLWNYIMPLKSLEHPALLQSILAISSLHIAKLQGASLTITLKHYHYALRKISRAVGLPMRRKQVSTLATTLLLAFYEVIAAEHGKWNSHVAGAAQLIKEIDFSGLTRDLRAHRRNVKAQRQEWWGHYDDLSALDYAEDDPFAEKESDIDQSLLTAITGKAVDYDRMGHVEHDIQARKKHFTRKDIETFTTQRDLYWWYCKQDLLQSMISGNRLFTSYDRWDQCPPRAGLGKLDALYGSFDHLVLLMGRTMDFGYRDRQRKIKGLEATGGEWQPHLDFFKYMGRFGSKPPGGGPPGPGAGPPSGTRPPHGNRQGSDSGGHTSSSTHPPDATSGPPSAQGPPASTNLRQAPMYGMAPSAGPGVAPAAFTETGDSSPYAGSTDEDSLMSTSEAEAEWEGLLAAYDLYAGRLGAGFAPLPADIAPPIATPFGPALQYRSHLIAVLWTYYYAGRIMLHRLHPCMPPAALVAAGAAAGATAQYAQIVGKIAAGIYYPQRSNLEAGSLNPTLGAALTEVTVPMFFAGVQLTDAAQRGWTVAKLRNIARITGWQSAAAIAGGCEASWYFAAKAGRGPPYASYEVKTGRDETGLRRIHRDSEGDKQVHLDPNNDRRFVKVVKSIRAHWAMGLLEMEDDLVNLNLDDDPLP